MFWVWQLSVLRLWIFFTAILSVFDFSRCYSSVAGQAHLKATYPQAPWQETSKLAARQHGFSQLLLVLIRIYGGMYFSDPAAYRVCHISFIIVFFHFVWERFGTQTVGARNLSVTEIITLITIWWMFVSGQPLHEEELEHGFHGAMKHAIPH